MAALSISGLTKSFADQPVLRGLDLDVPTGQLVAILGASGSGKTTLLRLLCGFERADSGSIVLDGRTVAGPRRHLPPERRRIGYVAQEGALFPHLSVAANVLFGLPRRERRDHDRALALLRGVGLPASYAARGPHQLSGGEQQRVALARALAPAPSLVLLDEPFSALDAALRAETRQAVAAALSAAGATSLLVTHDQAEALSMGHQVAVLRDGRLVQVATPQTLYRRPIDADLARFVGDAIILPGRASNGTVACALGTLTLADDMPTGNVDVLIRPEQVRLDPTATRRVRVSNVTYYGHDASIRLDLPTPDSPTPDSPTPDLPVADPLALSARVHGHAAPKPGDETGLLVDGPVVTWPRKINPASAPH
ncbi:ABC transporter ATP-binding protein [Rhodopila sp.]|uniref:ABC transporter ATP-binding protein n=1 Tax=Rhodopila sp. TaxID=2480087 RepID=UPI003D0999F5